MSFPTFFGAVLPFSSFYHNVVLEKITVNLPIHPPYKILRNFSAGKVRKTFPSMRNKNDHLA